MGLKDIFEGYAMVLHLDSGSRCIICDLMCQTPRTAHQNGQYY